jgi:putative nucleotidyltransferase with HDIG domain
MNMSDSSVSYEYSQRVRTLSFVISIVLVASLFLGLLNIQFRTWDSVIALFGLALFCVPLLWLNTKGHFTIPAFFLSLIVLMVINVNMWDGDGIRDFGLLAYPIFIMIGILFFGRRTVFWFTLASIVSLVAIAFLEIHGYVHPTIGPTRYSDLIPVVILLVVAATVTWVVARNIDSNLERVKKSESELRTNYDLTLEAWAKVLEYRDKETEGHSRRLVELSTQLARALKVSEEEIVYLRRGALLHDIGKLAVPDHILLKPGALDEEERKLLQQHPVYAKQMLSQVSFLQRSIDVAYSHHERWDGKGYPDGLKGEQIPLSARIFTVVDQWDALRSDRPYRKAWPAEKVIAYFRENAGTIFDPHILGVFLEIVSRNEAGTNN